MYRLVFTKGGDPETKFQWRDPFDDLPDDLLNQAIEEYPADEGYVPQVEKLVSTSGDKSEWVEDPVDSDTDSVDDFS